MFSTRVPATFEPNRLSRVLARWQAEGTPLVDLTETNPTHVGLRYPADLLQPLADPAGLDYEPHPFGLPSARTAVADDYARRSLLVDPDRIILTASTSEAYSLLFKLLCDPGDEVLVPVPSYPLFEHLARLDCVGAVPYALECHGLWQIDRSSLERQLSSRTRIVLTVHPNNPTGSLIGAEELDWLAQLCASRGIALVGDEVFADYRLDPSDHAAGSVLDAATQRSDDEGARLVCSLGGLSKSVGLPQLKLGWIALGGSSTAVFAAVSRLELICDTYLSVATPVQLAAPALLKAGAVMRRQIQGRVLANYRTLHRIAADHPACRVLRAEGGWSAVIQVPATQPEETLVVALLEEAAVVVHPGYFFDFPREAFLVVSLLPPEDAFRLAIGRVFEVLERNP